jgi:hypothetical protein
LCFRKSANDRRRFTRIALRAGPVVPAAVRPCQAAPATLAGDLASQVEWRRRAASQSRQQLLAQQPTHSCSHHRRHPRLSTWAARSMPRRHARRVKAILRPRSDGVVPGQHTAGTVYCQANMLPHLPAVRRSAGRCRNAITTARALSARAHPPGTFSPAFLRFMRRRGCSTARNAALLCRSRREPAIDT